MDLNVTIIQAISSDTPKKQIFFKKASFWASLDQLKKAVFGKAHKLQIHTFHN